MKGCFQENTGGVQQWFSPVKPTAEYPLTPNNTFQQNFTSSGTHNVTHFAHMPSLHVFALSFLYKGLLQRRHQSCGPNINEATVADD